MDRLRVSELRAAVRANEAAEVERLLAGDSDAIERRFPCSFHTPLSLAASEGCLETVIRLLELGASPRPGSALPVTTALHEAARLGHNLIAIALLEAGADPALPDVSGFTALDLAAANSHLDTARCLVLHVSPGERRRHEGVCATALFHACSMGCGETVDYLPRFGVPLNAFTATQMSDPDLLSRIARDDVKHLDIRHPAYRCFLADNAQPIHYAAAEGGAPMLRALLDLGADPCAKTASGFNALAVAATADAVTGRDPEVERKIINVLEGVAHRLGTGAPEQKPGQAEVPIKKVARENMSRGGETTLLLLEAYLPLDPSAAVALDEARMLAALCDAGCDMEELVPALCLACWLGRAEAVGILLAFGVPATAELPGRPGLSALRLAAQGPVSWHTESLRKVSLKDRMNLSEAITAALAVKRVKIVEKLLSHGAEDGAGAALTDAIKANKTNVARAILQHHACSSGEGGVPLGQALSTAILLANGSMLSALLEHGVDPNGPIFDLNGMRPLHVALAWHGLKAVGFVNTLLEHGADPTLPDETHDAHALDWARHGCWPEEVPEELAKRLV